MTKFLILGILILAGYLGLSYLSFFDSNLQILTDYLEIEMSLFTFISLFLIAQFLLFIILRLVNSFISLPGCLMAYWQNRTTQKISQKFRDMLVNLAIGCQNKAHDIAKDIKEQVQVADQPIIELAIAQGSKDINEQIEYYHKFLASKNKEYKKYAVKKLAQLYFKKKEWLKAEQYALEYFDFDDKEQDNIFLLMKIYAALKERHKLLLLLDKLEYFEKNILDEHAEEISDYLYDAANILVASSEEREAMRYLERSLSVCPRHLPSLNLYIELTSNVHDNGATHKILQAAFKTSPCFEVAQLYINFRQNVSNEELYKELSSLVNPYNSKGTFLAIAAYLDLEKYIAKLK